MRAIVFAASAFLLTACAGTPAAAPPACPPVKTYSQADQNALAAAVTALPPDNPLVGAMLDYGRLRAAARACAKP